MPVAAKTTELTPNHVPSLMQVPQAIEMQMERPSSFIEENGMKESIKRAGIVFKTKNL